MHRGRRRIGSPAGRSRTFRRSANYSALVSSLPGTLAAKDRCSWDSEREFLKAAQCPRPIRAGCLTTMFRPPPAELLWLLLPTRLSRNALQPLKIPLLADTDRKSTRLNSSHLVIPYAVFCL